MAKDLNIYGCDKYLLECIHDHIIDRLVWLVNHLSVLSTKQDQN